MQQVLTAKNIKKSFFTPSEVEVLKGVSIDVAECESVAIMGASGEGKTTLLQVLGTLEEPCSGKIFIKGAQANRNTQHIHRNQDIGFVFQSFHLLEEFTALENVIMPALIKRESRKQVEERAKMLLDKVSMGHRCNFLAKVLSGGEKQRVAIARSMMNDPSLIIADEPSGNLDHKCSDEIHKLLMSFVEDFKKSLIVATHNKELAKLCKRCYTLRDGVLIESSL